MGDTSEEDGVKLGDPICDTYSFEAFDSKNVIFAVADGCNWGPKPLEAARIASTVFQDYMKSKLPRIDSVRKAGKCLVKAFMQAHTRILQAPLKVADRVFVCVRVCVCVWLCAAVCAVMC